MEEKSCHHLRRVYDRVEQRGGGMSNVGEALGSLAEGALYARAVEPKAGEGGHTREGACLNCGAALVGPHCHQCGQRAHVHRTISAFVHDLLHGVLHFEGKTWRTLPLLAWRPGKLTREYIDGRRASYVSPIALFLFVVFLTFAGFHALGNTINLGDSVSLNGQKTSIVEAERQLNGEIAAAEKERAAALAAHRPTADLDEEIKGLRRALETTEAIKRNDIEGFAKGVTPLGDAQSAKPARNPIDNAWRKAKANPELLVYKLQSNAYKYSWLLIPISVPFMWLLFPFSRRFHLYDHTVFVTYSLSFVSLALLLAATAAKWRVAPLMAAVVLYVPFHMYRQIHETYGTSRIGAVARTFALLWFAAIALTIWGVAIFALILE
jgi:hypothetical protein